MMRVELLWACQDVGCGFFQVEADSRISLGVDHIEVGCVLPHDVVEVLFGQLRADFADLM